MRARSIVAGCVLAAFATAAGGQARRGAVYALVGGRVVTVSGPVHDPGTVVLRDGLIEAVGAGTAVPADARVIDVKGLTVTPGIIDGLGSVGLPAPRGGGRAGEGAAAAAAPSAPSALAPQALALERVRPAEALKARDHGITTALVIPRDGVVPGRSVLLNLAGESAEAMVLKQPAALHLQMTTAPRGYPGSLMGTVAYARQALLDAGHYREEWRAYEASPRGRRRPRYDSALQAWQDVLAGRELLVVTAPRENDLRRTLALADEFKVKVAAAGANQAARVADLVKARSLPLLVTVNFDPPRPPRSGFGGGAVDEDRERREIDEAERNPALLHEMGVRFALVSGHASDFLAGVRKAIERGLPAEAALRAVTLAPAEALGVADRLGSLEAGKIANVVVWTAEPLSREAKPKMVFVDGVPYEPEDRPEQRRRDADPRPQERSPEERAPEKPPSSPAPAPPGSVPIPLTPSPAPSPVLSPSPSPSPGQEAR